ncbi:Oxido-reductase [Frankia canadensis]|uniref:Oxido-reductase n=1 Tax=Frankia canadensis TaxID=1836972 RepID=A0A2I2KKR2_9ACTN|nr:NAD(P)/FAD-dependent oxidoreductase [Frankia canadensis]SNQ46262.1 Oxido-reductase [Frankia canadensis]SOU53552.1 Oxido-reductase [Frankia canadensis]
MPLNSPADDLSRTVVIGAGPAGLTAAHQLAERGLPVSVFEADDVVGGISRTVVRDGWRFDIGGHRFFTKVARVEQLWHRILGDEDFLIRPRMSRIYYRGNLYDYPLRPLNALRNLGPRDSALALASYGWARLRPPRDPDADYEAWLVSRFGWRLYRTFFKTYTEKVWGMPVSEMPADWAAQRVKNMSLAAAVLDAVRPGRGRSDITSLIERFHYPRLGPGMMWEAAARQVVKMGGSLTLNAAVTAVHRSGGQVGAVTVTPTSGEPYQVAADHVISSTPLSTLVASIDPPPPPPVLDAARDLRYRDYLTVALVVPQEFGFPDNWIYIHDPGVRVGRIQNYGSWSPFMVKDGRTCLGLEYFVFEGDDMWSRSDDDLVTLAIAELETLGLVRPGAVEAGHVVRVPKAYPTYDQYYRRNVEVIRAWLAANLPQVHPVGRNGMHRYNNADHSMLTAMLTVENILDGTDHDVWSVNVDQEYHEQTTSAGADAGTDDGPGWARGTGRGAPVVRRAARPS